MRPALAGTRGLGRDWSSGTAASPGGETAGASLEARFRSTPEVFVDPTSGRTMRVFIDPETGERRYRIEA